MKIKLLIPFVIAMLLVAYLQFSYDSRIGYFTERDVFFALPTGKVLKILSFGNQNFLADMIFIWSIQFYTTYHYKNRFDFVENIFNIITDLDTQHKIAYYIGSIIMSLEAKEFQKAIKLLQKGSKNMKDEWVFDYESAYIALKFLKDYKLAEKYYFKAAKNPDAPAIIKRMGAHMVYMRDNLEYAFNLWMEILNNAESQLEKNVAKNHLYQIKFEMDKRFLEQKIISFKDRYGRFPNGLNELRRSGMIKQIYKDFDGNDYVYDSRQGKIKAKKIFRWKKYF
jgi:tetratricopeptide (TPR) repeat protein